MLRLVVPWALIGILIGSAVSNGDFYHWAYFAQLICYALALVGVLAGTRLRSRSVAVAGSFLVLNAAAWLAFWVWITGGANSTWYKVKYEDSADRTSEI